ncbi:MULTISPECIES: S8 family serine peptidase [unclassified Bradyrhizobium]|uniref:S8 family serine peptidase n=1 Tax=unclassified Bradyrhizobium TaxID=2631580 RepID=UPI0028EC31B8|nr:MULTISPECIES: S8 family serine peptidase [unclassified Bradyrhizobium]
MKFEKDVSPHVRKTLLQQSLGGNSHIAATSEYRSTALNLTDLVQIADAVVLDRLGVAVLKGTDDVSSRSAELEDMPGIRRVMPEFFVFSYDEAGDSIHEDTAEVTWGVDAIGASRCSFSGAGVKLGILDSGFDKTHPDFAGRPVKMWSAFGCAGDDFQGHGTHCAGTAAGPHATTGRMRYGVAPGTDLHIYKVLNDKGFGTDGDVLAGIEKALEDGCDVISMSFGRGVASGTLPHSIYDDVASAALDVGVLLIAAAGNSSSRDVGHIAPVDYPANSPSIMAVGAVDSRLRVANFSNGSAPGASAAAIGGVDIAAPGAGVFSAVPMPRQYRRLRGTSMAAPHVAGVACLWAEMDASLRGRALWTALTSNAKSLHGARGDVGAGLVQSPFTER